MLPLIHEIPHRYHQHIIGTLVLVGGAIWSAWIFCRRRMMKERMVRLILLAVGAMTVAAGGSLTRLGHEQYLYVAMSVGVALTFRGYLKTIQTVPQPVVATSATTIKAGHSKSTTEVHAGKYAKR